MKPDGVINSALRPAAGPRTRPPSRSLDNTQPHPWRRWWSRRPSTGQVGSRRARRGSASGTGASRWVAPRAVSSPRVARAGGRISARRGAGCSGSADVNLCCRHPGLSVRAAGAERARARGLRRAAAPDDTARGRRAMRPARRVLRDGQCCSCCSSLASRPSGRRRILTGRRH